MTIEYYPSDGTGMMSSLDDDFMDFTDNSLFNSLCNSGGNNYLEFPNPREIGTYLVYENLSYRTILYFDGKSSFLRKILLFYVKFSFLRYFIGFFSI